MGSVEHGKATLAHFCLFAVCRCCCCSANFHHRLHAHQHLRFGIPLAVRMRMSNTSIYLLKLWKYSENKRRKHSPKFRADAVAADVAVIRLSKLHWRRKTKKKWKNEKANVISYALSCSSSPNLNIRVLPSFPFRQSFFFSRSFVFWDFVFTISVLPLSVIDTDTDTFCWNPWFLVCSISKWIYLICACVGVYILCVSCSFLGFFWHLLEQHRNEYVINNPFL